MNKSIFFIVISLLLSSCGFAKKDDKMMSAKEIIKMVDKGKPVQLFDKIIIDDLDFTEVKEQVVDGNANLIHKVNNDVVFVKCVFLGKVIATKKEKRSHKTRFNADVTFRNCDFRNEVDFSNTVINGILNMSQSIYREKTCFNGLNVKGNSALFWEIIAEKDFSMVNSYILGDLNFFDAHFANTCNLQKTDCKSLQLNNVQCDSTLELSMSSIKERLSINYGRFDNSVYLSDCRIIGNLDIIKSVFSNSFEIDKTICFGESRFNGTRFNHEVKSDNCYFFTKPYYDNVDLPSKLSVKVVNSSNFEIK